MDADEGRDVWVDGWTTASKGGDPLERSIVQNCGDKGAVGFDGGAPGARMHNAANAIAAARDIIARDLHVNPARTHSPLTPRAKTHPAARANEEPRFGTRQKQVGSRKKMIPFSDRRHFVGRAKEG